MEDILITLGMYWDTQLELDQSIKDIRISGKLVLRDNLEDILEGLTLITPIVYNYNEGKYHIKKKR